MLLGRTVTGLDVRSLTCEYTYHPPGRRAGLLQKYGFRWLALYLTFPGISVL
jgi:hypothetical protein